MSDDQAGAGGAPPSAAAIPGQHSILQIIADPRYTHGLFRYRAEGAERDEVFRLPFVGWGIEVTWVLPAGERHDDYDVSTYSTQVTSLFVNDEGFVVSRRELIQENQCQLVRLIAVEPGGRF